MSERINELDHRIEALPPEITTNRTALIIMMRSVIITLRVLEALRGKSGYVDTLRSNYTYGLTNIPSESRGYALGIILDVQAIHDFTCGIPTLNDPPHEPLVLPYEPILLRIAVAAMRLGLEVIEKCYPCVTACHLAQMVGDLDRYGQSLWKIDEPDTGLMSNAEPGAGTEPSIEPVAGDKPTGDRLLTASAESAPAIDPTVTTERVPAIEHTTDNVPTPETESTFGSVFRPVLFDWACHPDEAHTVLRWRMKSLERQLRGEIAELLKKK